MLEKTRQAGKSKLTPDWQKTSVFESVFDQLPDALVLYDPEFRITGVNRSAEELFGLPSDEMLGKHCREVFQCVGSAPVGGLVLDKVTSPEHGTVMLKTGAGRERLVMMHTRPILSDDGQIAGAAATISDITHGVAPQTRALIAESAIMLEILHFVQRIAASEAGTILLDGESGTGKDLIAKTLHYQSVRQAEPFIAVNCAAIPGTLLESELFGYERGAFTDARAQKRGILNWRTEARSSWTKLAKFR